MTVEDIVKEIQSGRDDLYPELWDRTKGFITMMAKRYLLILHGSRAVELEDLVQSGYIALVEAVRLYEPAEAAFLTYLRFYLRRQFRLAAGLYTERTARDPINTAADIDSPIKDDGIILEEIIPGNGHELEDAENILWREQLRAVLDQALDDLKPVEADAIRRHYYKGQTLDEIATERGVSRNLIRQRENEGMRKLRRRAKHFNLDEFIELQTPYYLHTNFDSSQMSPVEKIAMLREELRRRYGTNTSKI